MIDDLDLNYLNVFVKAVILRQKMMLWPINWASYKKFKKTSKIKIKLDKFKECLSVEMDDQHAHLYQGLSKQQEMGFTPVTKALQSNEGT